MLFAANTVSWAAGNPGTAKGQVTGKGTYTVDPGWTAIGSAMNAIPAAGGSGNTSMGTVTPPPGMTWGVADMTGLPTGQYNVIVSVSFKMGTTVILKYSPTAIVNVP